MFRDIEDPTVNSIGSCCVGSVSVIKKIFRELIRKWQLKKKSKYFNNIIYFLRGNLASFSVFSKYNFSKKGFHLQCDSVMKQWNIWYRNVCNYDLSGVTREIVFNWTFEVPETCFSSQHDAAFVIQINELGWLTCWQMEALPYTFHVDIFLKSELTSEIQWIKIYLSLHNKYACYYNVC